MTEAGGGEAVGTPSSNCTRLTILNGLSCRWGALEEISGSLCLIITIILNLIQWLTEPWRSEEADIFTLNLHSGHVFMEQWNEQ